MVPPRSFLQAATATSLLPLAFSPLPLGSIKPQGWLRIEMEGLATGLAGHLYDFYAYVSDSPWLHANGSGSEYSPLNEALPYWFNGIVPLAYSLDGPEGDRLKDQVHEVAQTILGLQDKDGWMGPEKPSSRNFWARTPLFLGLTQLAEANTSHWEGPVLHGLREFMDLANEMLRNNSFGFTRCTDSSIDCRWGQVRVQDLIITAQWMLEKFPSTQDSLLWDNMNMWYNQSSYKWDTWYTADTYPKVVSDPTSSNPSFEYLHGVNVGQGLKASAVVQRFTHDSDLEATTMRAVSWTLQYHGAPSGTVLADEIQRDLASYMGSELCTAVETAYSLSYLYQAFGNQYYANLAERTIFNALAVMFTEDKWAHEYMAQPNEPWTNNTNVDSPWGPQVFTTSETNIATRYGMEPQYPCCTTNGGQGYPKFLSNSWATLSDGGKTSGLVHALLSPSTVTAKLDGGQVNVACDTSYPFTNVLNYTVDATIPFTLYIRVPTSYNANKTTIILNDGTPSPVSPDPTSGLHAVKLPAGASQIIYSISMDIRTESRPRDAVSVFVGNMLYALDVGLAETSTAAHSSSGPSGPGLSNLPYPELRDYFMWNTSAWNVAIDPSTAVFHPPSAAGHFGFGQDDDWGYITVKGCQIDWPLFQQSTPDLVPEADNRTCLGDIEDYRMVPYGLGRPHMSELPVVSLKGPAASS